MTWFEIELNVFLDKFFDLLQKYKPIRNAIVHIKNLDKLNLVMAVGLRLKPIFANVLAASKIPLA